MTANLGKETGTLEFKSSLGQLDMGMKALSAMLNRHHYGRVLFGVGDNGDVVGIDPGGSSLEDIRNAIRTDILPRVVPEIRILGTDDGKTYVSVEVWGRSVPYSWEDRYFIRNVTSNESADPEVVSRIVMSRGLDSLKDIPSDSQDLTFENLFISLKSHGHQPCGDIGYYRSLGLLDDRGMFNINAYLLSDQNSIPMQVVEFRGTDRSDILRRTDFGRCNLVCSMDRIMDFVSGLQETVVDTDSLERRESPMFDLGAFREAWVNACVHNFWASYIPPSVLIFDDRMEIVSYGRIPFPIPDDEFFSGESRPVNPALFAMFARLNRIEQSGHGVPRIVRSYGKEAFRINDSGLTVTIPFGFEPRFVTMRRANDGHRKELPTEERRILDLLESSPTIKLSEVSRNTGISLSSVKKIVTGLKAKGLVRNTGTNRNSVWEITYRGRRQLGRGESRPRA